MDVSERIIQVLKRIVACLVTKNYKALAKDMELTENELQYIIEGIEEYNCTLVNIPEAFYENIAPAIIESWSDELMQCWQVDLPLWTQEEGRSDLVLSAYVYLTDERDYLKIEDIHVQ